MVRTSEPGTTGLHGHVAVHVEHNILVFGSGSQRKIWEYNLYTEQWTRHIVKKWKRDKDSIYRFSCAAAFGEDVYLFGGIKLNDEPTNALWKLQRTAQGFSWTKNEHNDKKNSPSPRYNHSGWEHEGQLWVFGGIGYSLDGYLDDHGDYAGSRCNNQLLCFCPSTNKWTNPQYNGSLSPMYGHATAKIKDKVFLFGGCVAYQVAFDDLHELDMISLTWTMISTDQPKPQGCFFLSWNAVSDSQLVLHGGARNCTCYERGECCSLTDVLSDTWLFDISTCSWREHVSDNKDEPRNRHTGSKGMNKNVIILGGIPEWKVEYKNYSPTFHITTEHEARSLKQIALQTIVQHKSEIRWRCLPDNLIHLLGFQQVTKKLKASKHRRFVRMK